jgi:hypothetical protein
MTDAPSEREIEALAKLMSEAAQPGYVFGADWLSDFAARHIAAAVLAAGYRTDPDAWRAGWEAGRDASTQACRDVLNGVFDSDRDHAEDVCIDAIAVLTPPQSPVTGAGDKIAAMADEARELMAKQPHQLVEDWWPATGHCFLCGQGRSHPIHTPATPPGHVLVPVSGEEAMLAERERIAAALEQEADLTLCDEDAKVVRGCAWLVRANFSYGEADRLEAAALGEHGDE